MDFTLDSLLNYNYTQKIRLGSENDGGYIIADGIGGYDLFLSCGIGQDISFELDFRKKYPSVVGYLFDGRVAKPPKPIDMEFIRKNIDKETNLKDYLKKYHDVFLKMDIEGSEFEFIDQLSQLEINNVKQIVIEIHNPFNKFRHECLKFLTQHHYIIHTHGNNFSNFRRFDGYLIPEVFELTLIRKKEVKALELNKVPYPIDLDQPNDCYKEDFTLDHYPWCMS